MFDRDFDAEDEAMAAFRERAQERMKQGYEVREEAVPELPAVP